MFEKIGHHVEKIKRIGYGPLNLDVEPGSFRTLTQGEVIALQRAVRVRKPRQTAPRTPQRGADLHGSKRAKGT
jgi:23S rRNA pseudouridine2605 synthase